jgi:hypothetical protein
MAISNAFMSGSIPPKLPSPPLLPPAPPFLLSPFLFRQMAPNLRGLFTKPRGLMADKLVNIISLLASLAGSQHLLSTTLQYFETSE